MDVSQSSVSKTDIPVCHVCQPLSQITVAGLSSTQTNECSKTDTLRSATLLCMPSSIGPMTFTVQHFIPHCKAP